jgi:hypothetical protein
MDEDLPAYTNIMRHSNHAPAHRSEHTSFLENGKGHKFLTMSVNSRSVDPKSLPLFLERDVISGHVELNLEKPEALKGVIISVSF